MKKLISFVKNLFFICEKSIFICEKLTFICKKKVFSFVKKRSSVFVTKIKRNLINFQFILSIVKYYNIKHTLDNQISFDYTLHVKNSKSIII